MKKNWISLIICFILSLLVVIGLPFIMKTSDVIAIEHPTKAIIDQKVTEYSSKKVTYNKIYHSGKLIGVITDLGKIYEGIENEYKNYEEDFPDTTLGLSEDLYIVQEDSYNIFEDKDDEIMAYLTDNSLLGIKTNAIEFSTANGVYDIIYVNDLNDFYAARDQFLLNFVSEDTLTALRNSDTISEPSDFGTREMNLKIEETMNFTQAFVPPSEIFTNETQIYNYLCYGRNSERQYYETVEGDTLRGVGYRFQNMSPKQLMMLNPDIISSEDQVLAVGTTLNVTYFSSPITVVVTKDRLTQEVINPENPEYKTDPSLAAGVRVVEVEEENGLKNVLYEETWVNGVLQTGSAKSSVVVREPVQGVITVGTQKVVNYGSGNYIWPVDNPAISCGWGCYYGHTGTDIVNLYDRYGPVYAIDTGVVETASYHYINGNYIVIDHGNDIKSYYGHLSAMFVSPGQTVQRGDVIGQIGMTGWATGPHVHLHFLVGGVITNACNYMNCSSLSGS